MTEFQGRRVVVVGASSGLGAGLVEAFASAGASVLALARRPAPEGYPGQVRFQSVNATDDAALGAVFDAEPPPWAVVNTVGGYVGRTAMTELDPEILLGQLRLNVVTAALITKHALRRMVPAGAGRLIHTSSRAATVTAGTSFAYSVSKLGVQHLVQMADAEVRGTGVTVNCVVPFIIDTPANRSAMPNADHASWPKIPDIARIYLYLASPAAGLVSGALVPV